MSRIAPFWSLADLVSESASPAAFQVSLEDMMSDTGRLVVNEFSRYDAKGTPFLEGDVLFGKLRPYLAKYWLADRPGTAGGDIHVYRPAPDVNPRFLRYIIGNRDFIKYAEAASKGVKMPRVEWMSLREFGVYRPDLLLQERIADYLDRETGEIDAMIAKMDELAETLTLRQRSIIDLSFFELRDAPNTTIQMVAEVTVGIVVEPAKLYVDGPSGIPALRGLNINPGQILDAHVVFISHEGHAANQKSALRSGDLVTVRTGRVGSTAVVPVEWDGANAIDLVITRPHRGNDSRFLFWLLESSGSRNQIEAEAVGSVQSHLNVGALKRLRVPVIARGEQQRIADHLDQVTSHIDAMLTKVAELKSLLTERRAALITEIVTGRKEVA
jgi:type I restriction enzyme S subunit